MRKRAAPSGFATSCACSPTATAASVATMGTAPAMTFRDGARMSAILRRQARATVGSIALYSADFRGGVCVSCVLSMLIGTVGALLVSTSALAHHGAASLYDVNEGNHAQGDDHRIRLDQSPRGDRDRARRRQGRALAARTGVSARTSRTRAGRASRSSRETW